MDRRESLKLIAWSTISTSLIVDACKTKDKPDEKTVAKDASASTIDRMDEEKAVYEKLIAEKFFTDHEMTTMAVLADIIIPRDEVSGSATDAKVPDFIEFMVKDKPELQTPMRGGLRWLDLQMVKQYNKPFKEATAQQQIAMVDQIAYPKKAKPEMKQGVSFFNLMRNLTASGFYTSEIGIKDMGYVGNKPNQWNGVPDDVLKQYGLSYTEKELKECVSFDKV
ncbi:MAG: gluconate 2-dehydrogenase subunit 3 family protein [Flavisolibacter sp.]